MDGQDRNIYASSPLGGGIINPRKPQAVPKIYTLDTAHCITFNVTAALAMYKVYVPRVSAILTIRAVAAAVSWRPYSVHTPHHVTHSGLAGHLGPRCLLHAPAADTGVCTWGRHRAVDRVHLAVPQAGAHQVLGRVIDGSSPGPPRGPACHKQG